MEELNGERVDMIEWSNDPIKLISTALQPAAISAVIIMNDTEHFDTENRRIKKRAAVFVEEAQRPMAIGKKGQNIRLATELTGYELDMYNYEELPAFKARLAQLRGGAIDSEADAEEVEAETEATDTVDAETETEAPKKAVKAKPAAKKEVAKKPAAKAKKADAKPAKKAAKK